MAADAALAGGATPAVPDYRTLVVGTTGEAALLALPTTDALRPTPGADVPATVATAGVCELDNAVVVPVVQAASKAVAPSNPVTVTNSRRETSAPPALAVAFCMAPFPISYCSTALIAAARARATSDGLCVPCWRNAVSFVQASPICGHVGE